MYSASTITLDILDSEYFDKYDSTEDKTAL